MLGGFALVLDDLPNDSLPEPDEATWAKISITVEREDGGIVDVESIRPKSWIELHGIEAGKLMPLNLPEERSGTTAFGI